MAHAPISLVAIPAGVAVAATHGVNPGRSVAARLAGRSAARAAGRRRSSTGAIDRAVGALDGLSTSSARLEGITVTAVALSRREQNKQEKRGRIIAAARALFRTKGFDATTTQEIAEAAGVASGTVFTYAKTKDDLLILVFHDEMMEVVEKGFRSSRRRTGLVEQAFAFFDTMVDYHLRDPALAHALMRQLGYVGSADQRALVSELMESLLGRLAELVEAGKSSGEVGARTSRSASARTLFAIYYFHLGNLLSGYLTRPQFDRGLRTDLGLLLTGLD
jgi:AcrR family transcriptional regulator